MQSRHEWEDPRSIRRRARRAVVAIAMTLALAPTLVAAAAVSAHADAMAWGDERSMHEDPAWPDDEEFAQEIDFDDAFGDDLLLFADLPVVITASRRAVPINHSPAPTSIITAADIHYSGLTRIDELLHFVPGVDMLRIDRNQTAIGVRGLHDFSSDRTLTLINGRPASNPHFGGPEFFRQPLFIEDIERIEVVRGPGGAAWGANAFNGVINIITKNPEDVRGIFLSTTITRFADTYSQFRWADQNDDWAWRLSLGYSNHRSSQDALGADDFRSRDFARSPAIDLEAMHRLSDSARLRMGVGYRYVERGDFEFLGFFPERDEQLHTLRAFARYEADLDDEVSFYIQWLTNHLDSDQSSLSHDIATETDFEAQVNFPLGKSHEISVGGNFRWSHLDSRINSEESFTYRGMPVDEFWAGLFLIDRWTITDRLTLDAQIRADYYSETTFDWSGRLSGILALDDQRRNMLRLSAARAFRAPLATFRRLEIHRLQVAPGLFAINLEPGPELDHEQIWSFEAGYTARLTDELTFRADGYFQRYEDLIGVESLPDPFGLGRQFFVFDNIDGADAYGAELELAWASESFSASTWYAFNDFAPDRSDQDVRSFLPAKHKVGASGRFHLPDDWTVSANYRWTNTTPGNPSSNTRIGPSHRIDLTLAKGFAEGRGELMIGCSDILDQTGQAILGLGNFTAHEIPGRTFFVRLQVNF